MTSPKDNTLATRALTPHLGVQVLHLDPNKPMDDTTIQALEDLIDTHQIVLLKSADPIDKAAQVALTRQLGEPWKYEYVPGQYRDYPEIFKVTNQQGDGFTNTGQAWHSDGSSECI